jgi:hypothetical protein
MDRYLTLSIKTVEIARAISDYKGREKTFELRSGFRDAAAHAFAQDERLGRMQKKS